MHLRASQTNNLTAKFTSVAGSQPDHLGAAVLRALRAWTAIAVGTDCTLIQTTRVSTPLPVRAVCRDPHAVPKPARLDVNEVSVPAAAGSGFGLQRREREAHRQQRAVLLRTCELQAPRWVCGTRAGR